MSTLTLRGVHLYLDVQHADGRTGEATVHLEGNGTLGVSCPAWGNAQQVAADAAPLLAAAHDDLVRRAADPSAWPTREEAAAWPHHLA